MLQLLPSSAMRAADEFTRAKKEISELELIEAASAAFVKIFIRNVSKNTAIAIFCGRGNNGTDGLVIARLLHDLGYRKLSIFLVNFSISSSSNYPLALERLRKSDIPVTEINGPTSFPSVDAKVIIDAIIGSGITKPLTSKYAKLINHLNELNKKVIAVDVPTGFPTEGAIVDSQAILKADMVITFARPKINFFFPESAPFIKTFKTVDIGLSHSFFKQYDGSWKLVTKKSIENIIKPRRPFSHKGTYGHALIIAGSDLFMGAALLSAKGCVYAGTGLTTAMVPKSGLTSLNTFLPEAMCLASDTFLTNKTTNNYTAICIGPGLGEGQNSNDLLNDILSLKQSLVVDADGINLLAKNPKSLKKLVPGSILTPHVKEFDRLFGVHSNWWDRVQTAQKQANKNQWVIILKNRYTFIALPSGDIYINPTGNPAMASGGMGDVLTGIITGLRAQGYLSEDAALLGVYVHGLAGDQLAKKRASITASQVATQIPLTIKNLTDNRCIRKKSRCLT